MPDDTHKETTIASCTVCGEPFSLEDGVTHGACLDCYLLNFAGAIQFQPPSRERGELTLMLRSREADLRQREAMRQWVNRRET
jgi:hypothetical protein